MDTTTDHFTPLALRMRGNKTRTFRTGDRFAVAMPDSSAYQQMLAEIHDLVAHPKKFCFYLGSTLCQYF